MAKHLSAELLKKICEDVREIIGSDDLSKQVRTGIPRCLPAAFLHCDT
jgi:hypothetical protein